MASSRIGTELEGKTALQVLPALEAGGAELGTLDIASALRDAGARVLVASSGGRMAAGLGADHVRLPVDTKNPIGLRRNSGRLGTLVAREGVDLVHAHSRAPAWSARATARRAGGHSSPPFTALTAPAAPANAPTSSATVQRNLWI